MTTTPGSSIPPDAGDGTVRAAVPEVPNRVRRMFANQTAWLIRYAGIGDRQDERVRRDGDLIAAITSSTGVLILPVDEDPAPERLDAAFSWLRMRRSGDVLIWSATSRPSLDLPLASRGCGDGFAPLWMWCDLPLADPAMPDAGAGDIEITPALDTDRHAIAGVPNITPESLAVMLDLAESPGTADAVWPLLARRRGRIIGGGAINLTGEGTKTVAGLYNLGVRPDMQGRGIGTALTVALCRIAAAQGAAGIALNATAAGEKVYRKVGFVETGRGQTWFLPSDRLRAFPGAETVRRAEALGSGMVEALDPALARTDRMPNGETPLTFAARFEQRTGERTGQRDSVRWLIANGAEQEIFALWKVGLRDEAIAAMGDRHLLDARRGPERTTSLHEAIRSDDEELVRMLIEAGADLTIRDGHYRGTPLGWAAALGRPHLARILEAAALGVAPDG